MPLFVLSFRSFPADLDVIPFAGQRPADTPAWLYAGQLFPIDDTNAIVIIRDYKGFVFQVRFSIQEKKKKFISHLPVYASNSR